MKIEYIGKNYTVSESLKKMTEKKSKKLKKFFGSDGELKYTITLEGNTYKTELFATVSGSSFKAMAESENPYANLDDVIPKIEAQVAKQKDAMIKSKKGLKKFGSKQKAKVAATVDEEEVKPEE